MNPLMRANGRGLAWALPVVAVALVLLIAACSPPPPGEVGATGPSREVGVGAPFAIEYREVVEVQPAALRVLFADVPKDTRCPADVECVWEGESRVALRVADADGEEHIVAIGTGEGQERTAEVGEYVIALVSLEPRPGFGRPVDPPEYSLTLRVDEA